MMHSRVLLVAGACAVFAITLVSPIQRSDAAYLVMGMVFQGALFAGLGALAYRSVPGAAGGLSRAMLGGFLILAGGFELVQGWLLAGAGDLWGVAAGSIGAMVGLSIAVASDRERKLPLPGALGAEEDLMGDWWRWGAED